MIDNIVGRRAVVRELVLIPKEDFDYTLRNKDGSAFPADLSFALTINETIRMFTFNAGRTTAALRIESTDISDTLHRQPYWITSKATATTPTTDKVLVQGQVIVDGVGGVW
ncbi:LtfC-like domain-containing protein [Rhodococcus globerulus]|uniref:LtfC/p132/Gp6 beta-sandwich domain-containing protein n=1 Tax=Rhodococcus globerulus TaxID=33008 RepID=A0ABU4C3N8_RHOGO|nr:hypothetical protein [Rhodococcus globerulus]MDV6271116.1 hypothetical protein [Rhodococcus globerulus]